MFKKFFLKKLTLYWYILFVLCPLFLILMISLSRVVHKAPPFLFPFSYDNDCFNICLNFSSLKTLLSDPFYIRGILSSIKIAFMSMVGCLLIGYPASYAISQLSKSKQMLVLVLMSVPFWTPFLIRVYGWMGLLSQTGLINQILLKIHIIKEPIVFLGGDFGVCIGMIYCYLPFMIFPIYSSLSKIDPCHVEAALNLGCPPFWIFMKIIMPLSLSGVISGCVLVFLPCLGEYVIPELLGSSDTLTIGRIVWSEFFINRHWPMACSIAVFLILLFVCPLIICNLKTMKKDTEA